MKKILKKEVIIAFIIGVLIASGITVYATSYFAQDISYTDKKSVASALDELYSLKTSSVQDLIDTSINNKISTQFYTLNSNISVNNGSEGIQVFDFSNLDTGTYIININLYSNADANSNVFGYLSNSESNKSKPSRFYFVGVNGYTVSNGSIVIEHTKNNNMKFVMNNYCGKAITIDASNSNASAIKIK